MRFASLGSGSRGNGTLIESGDVCVLVDCGFTVRETERRLARLGRCPEDLSAILVTHEHTDHIKGVPPLVRKYGTPVYATHGTVARGGLDTAPCYREIRLHEPFRIADLEVRPVTVPHDAREPCQFVLASGGKTFGVLTDLGSITPFVSEQYRCCDALMLECNHDVGMLAGGPYPEMLKRRVGGAWGHLSNYQASAFLAGLDTGRLQHVVMAHISEKNNTQALARESVSGVLGETGALLTADQESGLDWLELV